MFSVVLVFAVFMAFGDLLFLLQGVMQQSWIGVVFGLVGLLICLGYAGVAWRGRSVTTRLYQRQKTRIR